MVSYNQPNIIVRSTNCTQGILRLVVTGKVKCRSTDEIKRRIVEVRSLQVYYHSYLIHRSSDNHN